MRLVEQRLTIRRAMCRMTLVEIKERIVANAAILEKEGVCSASNNYQDLLNEIAQVRQICLAIVRVSGRRCRDANESC